MGRGNGESITANEKTSRHTNATETNQRPAFAVYRTEEVRMYPHRDAYPHPPMGPYAKIRNLRPQINASKGSMAPARKQNLRAGISKARAGRCRARAHDGHAQAWRTHVRNIYAHTKGFVDVGFVDVHAIGNLRSSEQCRCTDMGKSGVTALRYGAAFATQAC